MFIFLCGCLFIGPYFLDKGHFICPIKYEADMVIRSDGRGDGVFGAERNGRRLHQGVDLFAQVGTPVLASRSGRVVSAKQNNGMGKYIIIRHRDNLATLYGHLSQIFVSENETVRQGQIIGSVGKTGNARYKDIQPHLHFEVKKNGFYQDPLDYLE